MTTRSLFADDDEPQPRKRTAMIDDAMDAESLLRHMQTVMFMPGAHDKKAWHARAKGAQDFANADDPVEAMRNALKLRRT